MLVGQSADDMSKRRGMEIVPNKHFTTALRRNHWEQNKREAKLDKDGDFGTVGAVVLDRHGNLAAGGSTGGTSGKPRGRIGDTAILGAGLYADSKVAVVW
jgi:beta-aspartyl-peptidase (threonine type)